VLFVPSFCILNADAIVSCLAIIGCLAFAELIDIKFLLILRLSEMGFLIATKLIGVGSSFELISVRILQGLLCRTGRLAMSFASGVLTLVCLILLILFILAFIGLVLLNLAFPGLFIWRC
jgi:hypothetical protein